jgi:hypothetical protein
LARAGLLESKKIPFIKRAFEKDPANLTPAEKKIVLEFLDALMSEAIIAQIAKTNLTETSDHLSKFDSRAGNQWPSKRYANYTGPEEKVG